MMKGSSYLGSTPKRALSRPRRFSSIAAFFLVSAILLSSLATLPFLESIFGSKQENSSSEFLNDASALWCSDPKEGNLGWGMDNRAGWQSGSAWYPHADTVGRGLTTQEAFGNGVGFTNFNGVGESPGLPWFWISPPLGIPEAVNDAEEGLNSVVSYTDNTPEGAGAENWYKNMNSSRTPTKCVMGAVGATVANLILGLTTGITNLMGGIATFAFDPNFICEPNSGATNCIDLVGIIGGGGGSDEGIIGKLTSSVYLPLLTLVALLVGVYIIWNGLAKRQFRETFLGVIWSVVVTILGIAMLLNPLMLAKAPMLVSNALTSCIIGAFSGGGGCAGDSTESGPTETTQYCNASSNKSNFMDQAAITMTSMSCQLWKSFVLQPYAQGSFGVPLDQLDTNKSGTVANQLIAKNPGFKNNPSTFCVNTRVNGQLDERFGKTLELNGSNDICNLAIYQAYLGVDAKITGDSLAPTGAIDGRWLKVAQFAASDEGMYRSWAPSDFHLAQIAYAVIGLLSAIGAAIVVLVVSAFALAFYVTSILMIAFAPFFLLAGVHPGKGRKIMTGWIGQILSNVMKYAASAIFLVITISIYGAVLSNVSNMGAILIFMIILTVALLMYRREVVDMIGVIDLAGEKLSNKFAEKTMDRVRNTGKTAMAVGAGMTAGALSNGSINPFSIENMKTTLNAGNDSFRRSIKSRPGVFGEVMKAEDRISGDNRADMTKSAKAVGDKATKATSARASAENNLDELRTKLSTSAETTRDKMETLREQNAQASDKRAGVENNMANLESAQSTALSAVTSGDFSQYQDLLNQMKNLEMKAVISEESGNMDQARGYREDAETVEAEIEGLRSRLSDEDYQNGRREYNTALADNIDNPNVTPENVDRYENHVRSQYEKTLSTIGGTVAKAEALKAQQYAVERELTDAIVSTRSEVIELTKAEMNAIKAADIARENVIDLRPGQVITNRDVRKNAKKIAEARDENSHSAAYEAAGDIPGLTRTEPLTDFVKPEPLRDPVKPQPAASQPQPAASQPERAVPQPERAVPQPAAPVTTPAPEVTPQSRAKAEQDQAEERIRRAKAESQTRTRDAQDASSKALKDATDRKVNEINTSTENSLREIQSHRDDLERSMDNLAGGTNSGREYKDILDELDKVSAATDLSDSQLRDALENLSAESQELTDKVAGFSGGIAPQAEEVGQQIEDQISRIRALRTPKTQAPSANIRGADDGNPFKGGNPFKRK